MIIKGGTLITPRDVIENGFIKIEKDDQSRAKFTLVCSADNLDSRNTCLTEDREVIDASGKIVAPAFIDLHIQGIGGSDVWDGNYEAINVMSKTMVQFGVSGFLATTHYDPKTVELLSESISIGTEGAQVLGIYLEGPFINPQKRGAILEKYCKTTAAESSENLSDGQVQQIIERCGQHLKIMTLAPELEGAVKLIEILRGNGIVASAGHSNATYEEMTRGIEAGISHVTHLMNAMRGFHHREPGIVGAVLIDKAITAEVIADGVHLHPATLRLIAKCKGADKIAIVTDAIRAAGASADTLPFKNSEIRAKVFNGAPRLSDGTLSGSILTMDNGVRNMIELAGVSLKDAITMATLTPAKIIGVDDAKGSIEAGKDADVVIIGKDLQVDTTLINGEVRFKRQLNARHETI